MHEILNNRAKLWLANETQTHKILTKFQQNYTTLEFLSDQFFPQANFLIMNVAVFIKIFNQRDGAVVRAFALQSVDLEFIPQVESYQKTLKNSMHIFPAWRSAQ